MLKLDYQNILKERIGMRNGISKRSFDRFCSKHQKDVQAVFRSKNKQGYYFLNLPDDQSLVRRIKKYVTSQKKYKWENIVVLGIGGSSLGSIAALEALKGPLHHMKDKPRLFVVDNIDPAYTKELMDELEIKNTLFIVISKSGGTTEPMVLYGLVREELEKRFPKNFQKHLVFVTDPKSGLLRKIGKKEGIEMFDIPPKVGGRFSVLSAVGLLPLALVGIDITGLLRGAKNMREEIRKKKGSENLALALATFQYWFDRKKEKSMMVMMPYSNYLFRIGDWYRQLLAESIGKNSRTGPTPINALGTTDQHSQLQLYNQGPNNKCFIFLRLEKHLADINTGNKLPKELSFLNQQKMSHVIDAAYQGTVEALSKNGRPNVTLTLSQLNAGSIGELFMLFEFQVALLGLLYKVDAFSQPGVEQSKKITKQILSKTK